MKRIVLGTILSLALGSTLAAQSAFLTPTSAQFSDASTAVTVFVTSIPAASWTAYVQSGASWLSISGIASGTGDGSVMVQADPNFGDVSRTGVVMIAGQPFTVLQKANASAQSVTLAKDFVTFGETAGTADVQIVSDSTTGVTPGNGGSAWLTASLVPPASGTGPGVIHVSVQANNTAASRNGVVTYGDASIAIAQAPYKSGYQNVLAGVVRDSATRQPIPGARLFFYGTGYAYATADSNGVYSLTGSDISSFGGALSGTLYAGATGYFESSASVPDLGSQPSLPVIRDFTLQPGGTMVRGTIKDASTNLPIAGATVLFTRTPMSSFMGGGNQVSLTSASDGTYAIDSSYFNESGLTSGFSVSFQVNATGYLGASKQVPAFLTNPVSADIALTPTSGAVLQGHVTDRKTGQPIAGARLFFYGTGYGYATADSKGAYSFRGQDFTSFGGGLSGTLYVGATGYFESSASVPDLGSQPSLPVIRDFTLQPGGTMVRGTIKDASTNLPIAGATVLFTRTPMSSFMGGGSQVSLTSASDGTYAIDSSYFNESGLSSGFSASLGVNATGYLGASRQVSTFTVYPVTADVVLTPTSGAVLQGHVTGRKTGQPIAGAKLFFYGTGYGYATADSKGAYSFRGQDFTSFGGGLSGQLYVGATGYFESSASVPDLGSQPSLPVIRDFTLQPGGTMVRGTIKDASTNLPIAGATVLFTRTPMSSFMGGGSQVSLTSASDGTYAIDSSYFNESGMSSGFSASLGVNATGYLGATGATPTFTAFPVTEDFSLVSYIRLDPPSASVAASSNTGSFAVTLQGPDAGLPWSATSSYSWVTVNSIQQTASGGTVSYTIANNSTGLGRTGTIDIAVNNGTSSAATIVRRKEAGAVSATEPRVITGSGASFVITQSGPPPANISVAPNSGSGTSQIFTATYSDSQGYQDINLALFMVAGDATGVGGCFVMWQPGSNTFYLGNDTANAWLGPIQGGSSATLQNSQCTLNGASSSGSGSGNTLTAHFGLSFKAGFTGAKITYEMAIGSGGNTGWQQEGTWTPGSLQPPSNTSVTPNSGSGTSQIFTATYSDQQGYQDISLALFMVAGDASGVGGCFVMWQPGSNTFYLGNDTANTWLGPIQGGSSATLQNSQCTLNGASSSGGGSSNSLTVHFSLSFKAGFTGAKNTYQMVFGGGGNTGWQQEGTWAPGSLQPPSNTSVTPNSGSGSSQIFTAAYSDQQGYQDISYALFMVAGNATGVGGCFVMWAPGNYFYLGNDTATAWLGPIQGGSGATVQNSQCTLNAATSSGSGSGNTLTVHFGLNFANGFTGSKILYQMVIGSGGNTGWQQAGTWTLASVQPPSNVSVTPNSGSGSSQVFTATYLDGQGYQDISYALFMVAGNATGVGGCFVMWAPGNYFYLGNDSATAWLGPVRGGSSATVQNSQCTLNAATSSSNGSGNNLTVNFGLTFAGTFNSPQNTYQLVFGSGGNTGWQLMGTWTP